MAETGFSSFSTTVDKSNHVLKEIETAYNWPKERRNQSYDALWGVLRVLRDHLTVEETAQLAAQLPHADPRYVLGGSDPGSGEPTGIPLNGRIREPASCCRSRPPASTRTSPRRWRIRPQVAAPNRTSRSSTAR